METRFKQKLFVILFGCFCFIALGLYYLSESAHHSSPGILGEFVDTRWVITDVDSVQEAAHWGIGPNDEVLLVDNLPLSKNRYMQIWHRFTAQDSVTIKKTDGTVHQFLLRPSWSKAIGNYLAFVTVCITLLTAGSLTLLFHSNKKLSKTVYLFCFVLSITILSSKATSDTVTFARDIEVTGIVICLPLLSHLLGVFPKTRKSLGPQDLFALLPGIFILVSYYFWTLVLWQYVDLYIFQRIIVLIYLVIGLAGCLLQLSLQLYRTKLSKLPKRRALIALFLSLTPLLALSVIPTLFWGSPILDFDYSVILILPVVFSIWYMLKAKY